MASDINATKYSRLANFTVAQRIYFLLGLALLVLILVGSAGLLALNSNYLALSQSRAQLNTLYTGTTALNSMQHYYIQTMYEVDRGIILPPEGLKRLKQAENDLTQTIIPLYNATSRTDKRQTTDAVLQTFLALIKEVQPILESEDASIIATYVRKDLPEKTTALLKQLETTSNDDFNSARTSLLSAEQQSSQLVKRAGIGMMVILIITVILGYWIYQSIALSINRLTHTVRRIEKGDLAARAELEGKDELAELGYNLDRMMDERIATQARIDRDHQQLNESVFGLLQAVSDLSERNLTVRAKVTEDATGPLADAINQLAEDTTDVLKQVRHIALSVERAAADVNLHAMSVNQLSQIEQSEAQETRQQLDQVLERFNTIANSAQAANQMAATTSATTSQAQTTVNRTLDNMHNIRDGVKETSKRLKRLGERSQEISNIIHIIDTIAERTTVLALNASMQATAAGEAGRGFSSIAEEIQRLAESSRDSTDEISTLVHNIQQEANTTIATMERAIEQVVAGSDLAEETATQMQATLHATNELIASVEKIAESSADQIALSQAIQKRAERIFDATQTTGRELSSLTNLTKTMTDYSRRLVTSVNVFKLEA